MFQAKSKNLFLYSFILWTIFICIVLVICLSTASIAEAADLSTIIFDPDTTQPINITEENRNDFQNSKYIKNKDYFVNNPLHGSNKEGSENYVKIGTCTTVAMQILMGYHNYYTNRGLIPQRVGEKQFLHEDYGAVDKSPEVLHEKCKGQGSCYFGTTDDFYNELLLLNKRFKEVKNLSQSFSAVVGAANNFVDLYSTNDVECSFDSSIYEPVEVIAELDGGKPIILGCDPIFAVPDSIKMWHVVVAYGYATHDGELGYIVHDGVDSYSSEIWYPASWFGFQVRMNVNGTHNLVDTGVNIENSHRQLDCTLCKASFVDPLYNVRDGVITGCNYVLKGKVTVPSQIAKTKINKIGDFAFLDNGQNITQLIIESGISSIGQNAFSNLNIVELSMPHSIKVIEKEAFSNCLYLSRINDSNSTTTTSTDGQTKIIEALYITSLGKGSFYNCINLTDVPSFEYLQSIGEEAFMNCELMKSISLPKSTSDIGIRAFSGCSNLKFTVSSQNQNFFATNNILYSLDRTKILATGKIDADIVIANTVDEIMSYAFEGNNNITTLTLNYNIKIGINSFANCSNLETVYYYPLTEPQVKASSFSNTKFKLYTPYIYQDSFKNLFGKGVTDTDSILVSIRFSYDNHTTTLKVYYGSYLDIAIPEKVGYTFRMYLETELIENGMLWCYTTTKDIKGTWSIIKYFITYYYNGSEPVSNPETYTVNSNFVLAQPVKVGYSFKGWNTEENGNGEFISTIKLGSTGDLSLYAIWIVNNYNVILNCESSDLDQSILNLTYDEFYEIPVPTRQGYHFSGWFTSGDRQLTSINGKSFATWDIAEDTQIYAKWQVYKYSFKMSGVNGEELWINENGVSTSKVYIDYNAPMSIYSAITQYFKSVNKTGWIYSHYITNVNEDFKNSSSIPYVGDDGTEVRIYPKWTRESYTLFCYDGGDIIQTINTSYDAPISINQPSKNGYYFMGWEIFYSSTDVFGTDYDIGKPFNASTLSMPDLSPKLGSNATMCIKAIWVATTNNISTILQKNQNVKVGAIAITTKKVMYMN